LEAILGITLLNPVVTGDVIEFDNVGYAIPDSAFEFNTDLLSYDVASGVSAGLNSFSGCTSLISGFDNLIYAGNGCFRNCTLLVSKFQALITADDGCFKGCTSFSILNFSNVDNFGTTTADNNVFSGIAGITITVTAKSIHQTSNAGGLEGDLAYLAANNTVTFNWV
jgi:hypothetical protein